MSASIQPVARALSLTQLAEAMRSLELAHVDYGTILAEGGAKDPTLIHVVSGEIEAVAGDVSLRVFRAGTMLGQAQVFGDRPWPATLKVTRPASLLLAPVEIYDHLRESSNPVAWALERAALVDQVATLRELDARIASLAHGVDLEVRSPPRPFLNMLRVARRVGTVSASEVVAFLRGSELFRDAAPDAVRQLAELLSPLHRRAGTSLATQGERSDKLFFLAEGRVDVLVGTERGKHEPVATLEAGTIFGMISLLEDRSHMASIVAREEVQALVLQKSDLLRVVASDREVGSALRRALIRALVEQTGAAERELTRLDGWSKEALAREVSEHLYEAEPGDLEPSSRLRSGKLVLPG